jgi:hypothetical protein
MQLSMQLGIRDDGYFFLNIMKSDKKVLLVFSASPKPCVIFRHFIIAWEKDQSWKAANSHHTVHVVCDIPDGSMIVSRLVKINFLVNQ